MKIFISLTSRIIYQTETDAVHTGKDKDETLGVEVKYVKTSILNKKSRNQNKNFDNVNFRPVEDESKLPLQMSDMCGDTIVDEYPGLDDGEYDDTQPIIPNTV